MATFLQETLKRKEDSIKSFEHRLLRIQEVSELVGFRKSWIWAAVADGRFPAPHHIGAAARWSYAEVVDWISQQTDRKSRT
jgi:predicted DNA-binding transcriptional regulator AlpA